MVSTFGVVSDVRFARTTNKINLLWSVSTRFERAAGVEARPSGRGQKPPPYRDGVPLVRVKDTRGGRGFYLVDAFGRRHVQMFTERIPIILSLRMAGPCAKGRRVPTLLGYVARLLMA